LNFVYEEFLSYSQGPLNAIKFYGIGPTALLPFRRKSCYGFVSPSNIHCLWPGLNQRIVGPMASTIITRPLRKTTYI
jgi:hypothetical protein